MDDETSALSPAAVEDLAKIGAAWRELRRGAAATGLRRMLHATSAGLLDLGQVDALELLVGAGPVRMGELADLLRVDASSATRAVQRLVDAGLAHRGPDPCDRRGVVIEVTPGGEAILDEIHGRGRETFERLSAGFSPEELHQLGELMTRLVAAIDDVVTCGGSDAVDVEPVGRSQA
jgi:DNA-binding MarR family transcriptional regulator